MTDKSEEKSGVEFTESELVSRKLLVKLRENGTFGGFYYRDATKDDLVAVLKQNRDLFQAVMLEFGILVKQGDGNPATGSDAEAIQKFLYIEL